MKTLRAQGYTKADIKALSIRGQAEAVAPHRRPAYRRRLVAARRELSGIAAAYIDAILRRLDELDSLEVAR